MILSQLMRLPSVTLLVCSDNCSRSKRSVVRFFAAASDAFFAREPMADLLPDPGSYQTQRLPADRESIRRCPRCGKGETVRILTLAPTVPSPDSS
jgi:hypothetical protein